MSWLEVIQPTTGWDRRISIEHPLDDPPGVGKVMKRDGISSLTTLPRVQFALLHDASLKEWFHAFPLWSGTRVTHSVPDLVLPSVAPVQYWRVHIFKKYTVYLINCLCVFFFYVACQHPGGLAMYTRKSYFQLQRACGSGGSNMRNKSARNIRRRFRYDRARRV